MMRMPTVPGVFFQSVVSAFAPLIDYVSAILPRAQAVSRMPSAIEALRMCCQRRVAAGACEIGSAGSFGARRGRGNIASPIRYSSIQASVDIGL